MQKKAMCHVCREERGDVFLTLQDLVLHRCPECGLVFNAKALNPGEIHEIYDEKYFQKGYFNNCRKDYALTGEIKNYIKYLKILNQHCSSKGRLLDVGCGKGVFLDVAAQDGWSVSGQDISPIAARHVQAQFAFPIFVGDLSEASFPAASFDVITLWAVIEHIDAPQKMLNHVLRFLKKDGILFIWTLNQDCLMNQLAYHLYKLKVNFAAQGIYIPEHRCFFTQKNLAKIVEKSGLKILDKGLEEFPLERYDGNIVIKTGLQVIFSLQKILNKQSEQVLVCQK